MYIFYKCDYNGYKIKCTKQGKDRQEAKQNTDLNNRRCGWKTIIQEKQ